MAVVEFSPAYLAEVSALAEQSPRRRHHRNVHRDALESVQRLFNAVCTDSYIRPHRHLLDPKQECLLAVRGRFALVMFDDLGAITRIVAFGTRAGDAAGAELDPGQWHTVLALEPGSILFEVKAGPYDAHSAKEYAAWSPPEGSAEAERYMARLSCRAREACPIA